MNDSRLRRIVRLWAVCTASLLAIVAAIVFFGRSKLWPFVYPTTSVVFVDPTGKIYRQEGGEAP